MNRRVSLEKYLKLICYLRLLTARRTLNDFMKITAYWESI